MLGKYIPLEMLAQMPVSFVRRLASIKREQLEMEKNQMNTQTKGIPTINSTATEDLIDELS